MFTTVCSAAVYGLQAYLVRVEVDLAGGLPSFQLVGSPSMKYSIRVS